MSLFDSVSQLYSEWYTSFDLDCQGLIDTLNIQIEDYVDFIQDEDATTSDILAEWNALLQPRLDEWNAEMDKRDSESPYDTLSDIDSDEWFY